MYGCKNENNSIYVRYLGNIIKKTSNNESFRMHTSRYDLYVWDLIPHLYAYMDIENCMSC